MITVDRFLLSIIMMLVKYIYEKAFAQNIFDEQRINQNPSILLKA